MRGSPVAGLLCVLSASAWCAPWLTTPAGVPWPHRVILTTTGVGPATEDISPLGARSLCLLADRPALIGGERMLSGSPGAPLPFSTRDLNQDGKADELLFVSEYAGMYALYYSEAEGPTAQGTSGIVVGETTAGSWEPVHMPPVHLSAGDAAAPATSGANRDRARRLLEALRTPGPMVVLSSPQVELWVGKHSGLIERMRPGSYPWAGSCLREWAANLPNQPASGSLEVVEQSPVRVHLRHRGEATRDIELWADGTIFTSGGANWQQAALVVSATPYASARCEGDDRFSRFSEVLATGRTLRDTRAVALQGQAGEALTMSLTRAHFTSQGLWLDGGEIGWELASDVLLRQGGDRARFLSEASDLLRTAMSGALWVFRVEPDAGQERCRVDYRVAPGAAAAGDHLGMQRAALGTPEGPPEGAADEAAAPAAQGPDIQVRPLTRQVPCLFPNQGYGWRLKPFTRAIDNPLPAYFEVTLRNPSDRESEILGAVEAAPWLERVELLTNLETWQAPDGTTHRGHAMRGEVKPEKGRHPFRLQLPAGATGQFRLALKAAPTTDGRCTTALRIITLGAAVRKPLEFEVLPNIPLIDPEGLTHTDPAALRALGFNTVQATSVAAHGDLSRWLTEDGKLTAAALETMRHDEMERLAETHGLFVTQRLGIEALYRPDAPEPTDPVAARVRAMTAPARAAFIASIIGHYRPWERWITGYFGYDGSAAGASPPTDPTALAPLYDGFRAAANKPLLHSFSPRELAADFPARVPCDVPGASLAGGDAVVHQAVASLTTRHGSLFSGWLANPELSRVVPVGEQARPQYWLLLSSQIHHVDYPMMRRQAWWCRYHQVLEGGLGWTAPTGAELPGTTDVAPFAAIPTGEGGGLLLTDRALAIMDAGEDMAWITRLKATSAALARRGGAEARERIRRAQALEAEALRLSQDNRFDAARELIRSALGIVSG